MRKPISIAIPIPMPVSLICSARPCYKVCAECKGEVSTGYSPGCRDVQVLHNRNFIVAHLITTLHLFYTDYIYDLIPAQLGCAELAAATGGSESGAH